LNRFAAIALLVGICVVVAGSQSAVDPKQEAQLRKLFPSAASFSPRGGDPPHFKAFATSPSGQTVAGFAFWTTELQPFERGYDGPIKILVGLDTAARLTGLIVVDHHEPYGYFSVDLPGFAEQFRGKSIRDPFRLGSDIDAVSRATLTVGSSTRAVRDSARRIAEKLLKSEPR
jgi:transcriptional regulator of nitric oxide reductase